MKQSVLIATNRGYDTDCKTFKRNPEAISRTDLEKTGNYVKLMKKHKVI